MLLNNDRDELAAYMRRLADLVGLCAWEIKLSTQGPDNENHAASVHVWYGRKVASIYMQPDWASWEAEELRSTIVHELLHCHINPIRNVADNIESSVGKMIYTPLYNAMTDYIEYAVDAIATCWSETLPLPETPKKRRTRSTTASTTERSDATEKRLAQSTS